MINNTTRSRYAPPKASAMLETLRGLGYTTASALADIIDNSISAQSREVSITFFWKGESSAICIVDDGEGMNAAELDLAMRLGERNPVETREPRDLGRFGIGLKTASFSQCRRLTVASRKDDLINCLRWDLDVLSKSPDDGWHLLEDPATGSEEFLNLLDACKSGTLVLWELLDRVVTQGFTEQNFLDLMDSVERHLAMVFHRYLDGPRPRLRILINNKPVTPWDPFLVNHPAKPWTSPVINFQTGASIVEVQCHVLPHHDRLDQKEYENAAGPDGWTAHQGFYVYRNERLLVAGSWLALGHGRSWTKEEAHRLARIRIDISNSADADWKIDIRKSIARPPVVLRAQLTRLAEDTRKRARRVFAHRGHIVRSRGKGPVTQAWRAEYINGGMRYRIDQNHPAVQAVLEQSGSLSPQIHAMIRVIEQTIPVQRIWLDTTEGKDVPRTGFSCGAPSEVFDVLYVLYKNMVQKKGLAPELAKDKLLHTEPFHNYPELVSSLPADLDNEGGC